MSPGVDGKERRAEEPCQEEEEDQKRPPRISQQRGIHHFVSKRRARVFLIPSLAA